MIIIIIGGRVYGGGEREKVLRMQSMA